MIAVSFRIKNTCLKPPESSKQAQHGVKASKNIEIPSKILKHVVTETRSSFFSTSVQPNPLLTDPNCRARRALSESGLKSAETWAKRKEKAKIPLKFLVIF